MSAQIENMVDEIDEAVSALGIHTHELEARIARQAETIKKHQQIEDAARSGQRAVYVGRDGSIQNEPVMMGTCGPLTVVQRVELSTVVAQALLSSFMVSPLTVPTTTKRFALLGVVGKLVVYGEV